MRRAHGLSKSGPTRFFAAALAGALLAGACGERPDAPPAGAGAPGIQVVDADGRTLTLASPALRIVSLVPSATLALGAMGAGSQVVARTDFDTTSWAADLPSVGGGIEPSMEAIVAARPDLVIRFGGTQDPRTPATLDALGIAHLSIRPDRVADVLESIRLLGAVAGRSPAADSLVATIEGTLTGIAERNADQPRPMAVYVLGGNPPWVAGPGTYIDDLIALSGGVNVFSDLGQLYAAVSPEEFVARKIDVVLLSAGSTFDRSLARGARFAELGDALELPGPGVAEAALEVERALRPGGDG